MKSIIAKSITLGLLPVAVLALSSCSTTPEDGTVESSTAALYQPGVPGGMLIETYQERASIKSIDAASREVTLVQKDGTVTTVTAGPEVANFAQLAVGDQVVATVSDELEMYVLKPGERASDQAAAAVALAPLGEKPGGALAATTQITAKVTDVSLWHHTATLELPDGTRKTFKVRKDVKLTQEAVGREVVIRSTQTAAISVAKP